MVLNHTLTAIPTIMIIWVLSRTSISICLLVYIFLYDTEAENSPIFLAKFVIKSCRKSEVDLAFIAES